MVNHFSLTNLTIHVAVPEKLVEPLASLTEVYLELVYVDCSKIKRIMLRYKYTERSKKLINLFTINQLKFDTAKYHKMILIVWK